MAISTLLGQPANWGKISVISKNIPGSQGGHSPIPNKYVQIIGLGYLHKYPSNYKLLLQISLGVPSFNIKKRDEIFKILSHCWAPDKTLHQWQSQDPCPQMDSATLPIATSFYFLHLLLYSLHTPRFCNTRESSSTDKAGFSFTQLITRKHPVHAPNSRLA